MSMPTQITIYPDRDLADVTRFPSSSKRLAGERYQLGPATTNANAQFFGEDGAGISDVVDAINPLNHIPFISTLYEQATGHTASNASKLIGGALLGGPIGFLAALGNVIFEQETGHSMGGAVIAALTGSEPASTQMAAAAPAAAEKIAAIVAPSETPVAEILPPAPKAEEVAALVQDTQMNMAAAMDSVGSSGPEADMLSLFGADRVSAHESYRKTQFTPYLNDVSTSLVM